MKRLVNVEELVGKKIKRASIDFENDDSSYQKLKIETEDGCLMVVEGRADFDRCGDLDGVSLLEYTNRDELDFEYAKELGLYSEGEIREFEEAKRKRKEERERKAAYEKEQKRKAKEDAEIKKLRELAEKFNMKVESK